MLVSGPSNCLVLVMGLQAKTDKTHRPELKELQWSLVPSKRLTQIMNQTEIYEVN